MVWARISAGGKTAFMVLDGNLNAKIYIDMLKEHLLPYAPGTFGLNFTFMQDNSPVQTARVVSQWFNESKINVLNWLKSPDLNPIEIIWGLLA